MREDFIGGLLPSASARPASRQWNEVCSAASTTLSLPARIACFSGNDALL
jgi:hypothetical protein